jgi:ParB family transcriptional regulator, chromosome partitioning protein
MYDNVVKEKLLHIALKDIVSNRYQPREKFDEEEIRALADSILQVGLLHPPTVLERDGQYEIIAGERRVLACRLVGYTTIPVFVRDHMMSLQLAQAALIENMQRVDLNPIEIAKSIKSLMCEFDLSQEELAPRIGKRRSTVTNYLRLLQLPQRIQQALTDATVSMAHAKAILSAPQAFREKLFDEVITNGLTVRTTLSRACSMNSQKKGSAARKVRTFNEVEEQLQRFFGTKVRISKNHIEVSYHGIDDLDRLLELCSDV